MLRPQYKRLVKNYSIGIQQSNNYDISGNNELPEISFRVVEGRDLVVNDINYNIDSVGLYNGGNTLTYVYNKNNSLVFNSEPFKPLFDIDKESCILLIDSQFDISAHPILQYAVEGILTNNNDCIFNYLGHTTDSFYFYVKDGIIHEMTGATCHLDGVIKNTNCPFDSHVTVYGIFNTVPINMVVVGEVGFKDLADSGSLFKFNYSPTQLHYTVTTIQEGFFDPFGEKYVQAEHILNVKTSCFAEVIGNGSIFIDSLLYASGSMLCLNRHKNYNIRRGFTSFDMPVESSLYNKDYSALITKQVTDYYSYDQFKEETKTTINSSSVPTLLEISATVGLRLFYTNNDNQIIGQDEIYFFTDSGLYNHEQT